MQIKLMATHSAAPKDPASALDTPMARALLEELLCKLSALAQQGCPDRINLARLPLPPGTLATLRDWLGPGEIEATVRALGTTTISETGIAGVWWIRHAKADGTTVGESLEISLCPEILMARAEDAQDGAQRLQRRLAAPAAP